MHCVKEGKMYCAKEGKNAPCLGGKECIGLKERNNALC